MRHGASKRVGVGRATVIVARGDALGVSEPAETRHSTSKLIQTGHLRRKCAAKTVVVERAVE